VKIQKNVNNKTNYQKLEKKKIKEKNIFNDLKNNYYKNFNIKHINNSNIEFIFKILSLIFEIVINLIYMFLKT
jgi:hypothetical protein